MTEGLSIEVKEALGRYGCEGILFANSLSRESFEKGRIEAAINLPYSFLNPVPKEAVERLRETTMSLFTSVLPGGVRVSTKQSGHPPRHSPVLPGKG